MVYRYYLKINGEKILPKLQSIIGNFNNPIHLNSAYKIVSYNENNW